MPNKKHSSKAKKSNESWFKRHSLGLMIAVLTVIVAFFAVLAFAFIPYTGAKDSDGWIFIPHGATDEQVKDSLKSSLSSSMGTRVYLMWELMGGNPAKSEGAYQAVAGQTTLSIARRMVTGRQTPVKVTFNGTRTLANLADKISSQLQCSADDFIEACDEVLPSKGFSRATYPAAFIPDTYEFYWSATPTNIVKRLLDYRNNFWTEARLSKAQKLGLSKVEVATIASIIEEETAKKDERPQVARLYLNRLNRGMRLQADPTVKFAVGDFSLRRIKGEHLKKISPYNTYLNAGLPPGPIRIPAASSMDDVLNAPNHDYIYMCAKEDFSGYHNFAKTYTEHQANAKRYQSELNRKNIR